jgi:uncharacterized protein (TIGR02145 family)
MWSKFYRNILSLALSLSGFFTLNAQVGIGTNNPDPSSVLDVFSNEKGILIPRLSNQQRDSIVNPATGLTIYNTSSGCINYYISNGWMQLCGILIGKINALNCTSATHNGTLVRGFPASGVSSIVPYTGGNGGIYNGQTITSTGVTGLTATLTAGNFVMGSGTLSYTITGTPDTSGTAGFALNIGGKSCLLERVVSINSYPPGTVHCMATPTAIFEVLNPTTGKIWMDRNLGASQVATSFSDNASYGSQYQWGRRSDGHQCINSQTTSVLSNSDQPPHGKFITILANPQDWRNPQNINLWQGINGVNNPCPIGYRLPTRVELDAERSSWSSNDRDGAFASPLKFSAPGFRGSNNGGGQGEGDGQYWTSSIEGTYSWMLSFGISYASMEDYGRAQGLSVRCLKN